MSRTPGPVLTLYRGWPTVIVPVPLQGLPRVLFYAFHVHAPVGIFSVIQGRDCRYATEGVTVTSITGARLTWRVGDIAALWEVDIPRPAVTTETRWLDGHWQKLTSQGWMVHHG